MATDVEQITNLCHFYAEKVDTADFEAIGALFAEGATECFLLGAPNGGRCVGKAAVMAWYRGSVAVHEDGPGTRHVITNLIVEVDDDGDGATARARSYFTVLQCLPAFPLQVIAAGRYHDRFEKVGAGWRFVEKILHGDYVADLSRHFPPAATVGGAP
jgi:hypothetical protein